MGTRLTENGVVCCSMCVFIEISLYYVTENQKEREFFTLIVANTRSINQPRALLR